MAGWAAPFTVTSATPSTWLIFWAITVSAASNSAVTGSVSEVNARMMTGKAAELALR